jgi:hypothetical protein
MQSEKSPKLALKKWIGSLLYKDKPMRVSLSLYLYLITGFS